MDDALLLDQAWPGRERKPGYRGGGVTHSGRLLSWRSLHEHKTAVMMMNTQDYE